MESGSSFERPVTTILTILAKFVGILAGFFPLFFLIWTDSDSTAPSRPESVVSDAIAVGMICYPPFLWIQLLLRKRVPKHWGIDWAMALLTGLMAAYLCLLIYTENHFPKDEFDDFDFRLGSIWVRSTLFIWPTSFAAGLVYWKFSLSHKEWLYQQLSRRETD